MEDGDQLVYQYILVHREMSEERNEDWKKEKLYSGHTDGGASDDRLRCGCRAGTGGRRETG